MLFITAIPIPLNPWIILLGTVVARQCRVVYNFRTGSTYTM